MSAKFLLTFPSKGITISIVAGKIAVI